MRWCIMSMPRTPRVAITPIVANMIKSTFHINDLFMRLLPAFVWRRGRELSVPTDGRCLPHGSGVGTMSNEALSSVHFESSNQMLRSHRVPVDTRWNVVAPASKGGRELVVVVAVRSVMKCHSLRPPLFTPSSGLPRIWRRSQESPPSAPAQPPQSRCYYDNYPYRNSCIDALNWRL